MTVTMPQYFKLIQLIIHKVEDNSENPNLPHCHPINGVSAVTRKPAQVPPLLHAEPLYRL